MYVCIRVGLFCCEFMQYFQILVLYFAKTLIFLLLPSVTPDSGQPIENAVRIIFLLDGQESIIVYTIKNLLPIWIKRVCLIQVT